MKSLSDPTRLKPVDKKEGLVQVIIETPAGSRNKFAYDADQAIFAVKKVLPAGMVFPYDFGFLSQTIAPDGNTVLRYLIGRVVVSLFATFGAIVWPLCNRRCYKTESNCDRREIQPQGQNSLLLLYRLWHT